MGINLKEGVGITPTGTTAKELQRYGCQWEADLNTDSTYDVTFAEARRIQNFYTWIENFTSGDWIELQAYMPGDPPTAIPPKMGEKLYIPPTGIIMEIAEGTKDLPAGIILRFTYHSTATSGNKPKITAHIRTWL
jgi:hypothetical protein